MADLMQETSDPRIHKYPNGTSIILIQGPAHDGKTDKARRGPDPSSYGTLITDFKSYWSVIKSQLGILCGGDINLDFAVDAFKTANIIMLARDSNNHLRGVLASSEIKGDAKSPIRANGAFYYVDLICNAIQYTTVPPVKGKVAVARPVLAKKTEDSKGLKSTKPSAKKRISVAYPKGSQMLDLLKTISIQQNSKYLTEEGIPVGTPFKGIILRAINSVVTYYYNLGWRFKKKCDEEEKPWKFGDIIALLNLINLKNQFIINNGGDGDGILQFEKQGYEEILQKMLTSFKQFGDDTGELYTMPSYKKFVDMKTEIQEDLDNDEVDMLSTWGDKGTGAKVSEGDHEPTEGYTMIYCKNSEGFYTAPQELRWSSLIVFLNYIKGLSDAGMYKEVADQVRNLNLLKVLNKNLTWMSANKPHLVVCGNANELLENYIGPEVIKLLKQSKKGGRKKKNQKRKKTKKKALKKRHRLQKRRKTRRKTKRYNKLK